MIDAPTTAEMTLREINEAKNNDEQMSIAVAMNDQKYSASLCNGVEFVFQISGNNFVSSSRLPLKAAMAAARAKQPPRIAVSLAEINRKLGLVMWKPEVT